MKKKRVLFICTHNAARSQMAEGYLRAKYGDRFEAFSAGIHASRVSQYAAAVMKEIGVDISGHRSKTIAEFAGQEMDIVVTVCDDAKEACPTFRSAKRVIHAGFPNPRGYAGDIESILRGYRELRDAITRWIDTDLVPRA